MKTLTLIALTITLNACTITMTNTSTSGESTDAVDTTPSTKADVAPQITVPVSAI